MTIIEIQTLRFFVECAILGTLIAIAKNQGVFMIKMEKEILEIENAQKRNWERMIKELRCFTMEFHLNWKHQIEENKK